MPSAPLDPFQARLAKQREKAEHNQRVKEQQEAQARKSAAQEDAYRRVATGQYLRLLGPL